MYLDALECSSEKTYFPTESIPFAEDQRVDRTNYDSAYIYIIEDIKISKIQEYEVLSILQNRSD